MKIRMIALMLFALFVIGCEKDPLPLPTELPPNTEEGKNTFGCLIDEEIYVPESRRVIWVSIQFEPIEFDFPQYPDYQFGVRTIRFVHKNDDLMDARVEFYIDSVCNLGDYTLSIAEVQYNNSHYSGLINDASITITKLDSINGIISGQFHFRAIENNNYLPIDRLDSNLKTISISNGRFDLKRP